MQIGAATLENSIAVLQKLKIEVPYDLAIALLGIYPRDTKRLIWRGTCSPMFIGALSTIAKLWKESKYPLIDEWMKKRWYIYVIYKELLQPNSKNTQIIQLKNGQKTWTDISPKKTYRWPTDTWKDVQHHSSSGKIKSKPEWDITSHLSEWLKSKTQETTVGEDVETRNTHELLVECRLLQPPWKTVRKFLKKLKTELLYDPVILLLGIYPKNMKTLNQKIYVPQCLSHHYLQ